MIYRGFLLPCAFACIAAAQSSPITVVNAASYGPTLAPDSLATIFGVGLAQSTATAALDANGNLPLELASTSIDVNGQAAPLLYVSPSQINFVVPGGIGAGTTTLTIRYTNSSSTRGAGVTIAASAPALFSSGATGTGPGAILNAVTFAGPPFLVDTSQSPNDPRTRLAIYGTGFRHAKTVTARAADSRGNRLDLIVEYAGAAPGFFGLDQINVLLPPGLDGAGAASLTVTADDIASNTITAQIDLLPVSRLRLAGIALNPNFVSGGDSMTAAVSLNGVARTGGFPVSLRSTNLAAQPPASATIPEASASAQVTVATSSVSNVQTGSVQATAGGVTASADFEVDPASQSRLSAISVSPASILGGRSLSGSIILSAPAPAAGLKVQIASDNDEVRPPAVVNIPFNQSTGAFSIATLAVTGVVDATLTATQGRNTATARVKLLPPLIFTVDNTSVIGGNNITGTLALGEPAPAGGAQINLSSSDAITARTPPFLGISSGLGSGTFSIATSEVTSPRTAVITASYQNVTLQVSITVNPPTPPVLQSLSISPSTVTGGSSTQGIVTLAAPAGFGGQRIDLQSSALLTAFVPGFVMIPEGAANAQFTITTTRVASPQNVTITARMGNLTQTAILIVQ